MTERTCAACSEPVSDAFICNRCLNQTRSNLADQAAHYGELVTAMTRMVKLDSPNDGGRGADRNLGWAAMGPRFLSDITPQEVKEIAAALPPARPAADALHSQRSLLVSWCRLLVDEGMASGYPADSIPAMACFIEAHLRELRMHECAGELVTELKALNHRILRAIDVPEDRTRVHAGPCPRDVTEYADDGTAISTEPCPGQVMAHFPRDKSISPFMRCGACRKEWDSTQWNHIGELILRRKAS